jgi:beta-glucosidase
VDQTRLGIPIIFFGEALHGVIANDATVFPQSIALAATFDTALMHQVSKQIAVECKLRGMRDVLSPVVNLASDVRWGRTEETYGEDPFLSAEMGVAFVSEFEKMGIVTTPKHFVANVGDGGRDSYPIETSSRHLFEYDLVPFKACIQRGGSRSVMSAYNSLNGKSCSMNSFLLQDVLKNKWGFKGFVISDAGAVGGANVLHNTSHDYPESGKLAIDNGMDVIFQTSFEHYKLFNPHFIDGTVDSNRFNDAVSRVLRAKFELGLFEKPYADEKKITEAENKVTQQLAYRAAVESIVLLKNEKNILPLNKNLQSIAVIGIDAVEARTGGYSGTSSDSSTIINGIKSKLGKKTQINYAAGCGRVNDDFKVVDSKYLHTDKNENGLTVSFYNNITLTGNPVATQIDNQVNHHWTFMPPVDKVDVGFYSVRWTGNIIAPQSGTFKIGLQGNEGFRLYINDKLLIDDWKKQSYATQTVDFNFEKDKSYNIKIEFYESVGNGEIKLIWNVGVENNWQRKIDEAVAAASKSDIAIVAVGIEEGEFRDRAMLTLPGHQEELINKIAATGKPVVVLLIGGSAVTMSAWKDNVKGIVDVWYAGQQGGNAVAAVLFGDENPAGRLPITFPIDVAQVPLIYNHKPTGRGDDYNNLSGLPLFPFGYGLSYSTFEYSDLQLSKKIIGTNETTTIICKVKNTSKVAGDEVVQLYIKDLVATYSQPVIALKGFERIHFAAGETKSVSFAVTPEMLSLLNDKLQPVVEPGDFKVMIGASSADIKLMELLKVK